METLYTEDEIQIMAPVSKVWKTLIDPKMTKKYMFGCEVACDWQIGGPILWKGAEDGIVYVKGKLVSFEKERLFSFTTFDPNDTYEDIPENYLTATYTLKPEGEVTTLRVTQGDYATVAEGKKRYEDTIAAGGWSAVLKEIKTMLENE